MGLPSSAHGHPSRPQQPTLPLPGWKNESGRVQMQGMEAELEERKMTLIPLENAVGYSGNPS